MFGPLRPHVANWEQTGEALVQRVHREAVGGVPDRDHRALLDEVLALPGIPTAWRTPDFARTPLPLLPVVFAKDGRELRLLLDGDHGRHAAGRDAAGIAGRVVLPRDERAPGGQ